MRMEDEWMEEEDSQTKRQRRAKPPEPGIHLQQAVDAAGCSLFIVWTRECCSG